MPIKSLHVLICMLLLVCLSANQALSQSTGQTAEASVTINEGESITRTFGFGGLKVRAVANFGNPVPLNPDSIDPTLSTSWRWDFIGEATVPSQTYQVEINFYTPTGVRLSSAAFSQAVTVNSIAPDAVFSGSESVISEGESITLAFGAVLNDSPGDTATGFRYSFDCTGDGIFEAVDIVSNSYSCDYSDNGTFSAQGQVKDRDGDYSSGHFHTVTITNVPPSAVLLNLTPDAHPGDPVSLTFSNVSDPGSNDSAGGFLYSYDCTNDGVFELDASRDSSYSGCTYSAYGTYTAHGRIQDKDGGYSDAFAQIVISAAIPQACAMIGYFDSIIIRTDLSTEPIIGTDNNDLIIGTDGDDYIDGLGGDDCILGQGGSDEISGSAGSDIILGGAGSDGLYGGDGNDLIYGEQDSDLISGGNGTDQLNGDEGNDCIFGGNDNDTINAGSGHDNPVAGNNGDDVIYGGDGDDTLYGDALTGDAGSHVFPAEDSSASGNDVIYGEEGYDELFGGDGNDWLDGGNSSDQVLGESGNDTMTGGESSDFFGGGFDADTVNDFQASVDTCQEVEAGCS